MLGDSCLQFAEQLAGKAAQPEGWPSHPQLLTREVLADCTGPEAEWLMQASMPPGCEALLAVAECVGAEGYSGDLADATVTPSASPPRTWSRQAVEPAQAGAEEGQESSESSPREEAVVQTGVGMEREEEVAGGDGGCPTAQAAVEPEGEGQWGSPLPWGQQKQQRQQGQRQQVGDDEGSLPGSACSSLLTSPDQPPLEELVQGFDGTAQQQEQGQQAPPCRFVNPVFEDAGGEGAPSCQEASEEEPQGCGLSAAVPPTPNNRCSLFAGACITPSTSSQDSCCTTPLPHETAPVLAAARAVAMAERSRSLEVQLLGAGVGRGGGSATLPEAAELQLLQARLAAVEAEAVQLREEKAAAEVQSAALLDEVQLSFAALEASQAARAEAVVQQAKVSAALQLALQEQQVLAAQLDAARQELGESQQRIQRLEYQIELMQAERQEVGGCGLVEQHHNSRGFSAESMEGGELLAEVALLRGQLSEANRSKAVLVSKLQACRADYGALTARLQASQAQAGADLARQAAAAEEGSGSLRAQVAQLRAENQQLEAQVQLLQQQAAAVADSERAAALVGIVRQREEQLVQSHLEITELQTRLRDTATTEERCAALEGRVDLLLRQQEALADRLRCAQEESASWRSALSRLSDEMAACTAREAAAKSALKDTAAKLLAQEQLCEAQGDELEHLRGKADRGMRLSPLPPPPQQQQPREERQWQHWASSISQEASSGGGGASGGNAGEGGAHEAPALHLGQWGLPLPGAPSSEDDGSPRSRKSASSKSSWSWLKFKNSGH